MLNEKPCEKVSENTGAGDNGEPSDLENHSAHRGLVCGDPNEAQERLKRRAGGREGD